MNLKYSRKDKEKYSGANSDVIRNLSIRAIDYNMNTQQPNNSTKILSDILVDCVKYSFHNKDLSKDISLLVQNHFGDANHIYFLSIETAYVLNNSVFEKSHNKKPLADSRDSEISSHGVGGAPFRLSSDRILD